MAEPRYIFIEPGRARRERVAELKLLLREPPSSARAGHLGRLARAFHGERDLNEAMQVATTCLADDPHAPEALVAAYQTAHTPELQVEELAMLANLGRWIGDQRVVEAAVALAQAPARAWCDEVVGEARNGRMATLERRFNTTFAARVATAAETARH